MSTHGSRRIRRTALIIVSALLPGSPAFATLFYSATGYPDQSVTQGRYLYPSEILPDGYISTSQPISLNQPTHINTWNIIASTDAPNSGVSDWKNCLLDIGVWKATDTLTKEQAFDQSPNAGNAIAISHVTVASSQDLGVTASIHTDRNYYTGLAFPAFDLSAGDYLFGVQLEFPNGTWGIAESGINLGSGILTHDQIAGSHLENKTLGNSTTGTLAMDIGGTPLFPGDANYDGTVNAADFNILATHFNQTGATWATANFNGDGVTNALDFNTIATHYGQSANAPSAGALVPEPVSLTGLLCALVLMRRKGGTC